MSDFDEPALIACALDARRWSYSPYSRYPVGAALLADSGKVYDGCNIENAAYPESLCAERVAVFKAVSEGERRFVAIAVTTENGGSPCGACRQVLCEFGLDIVVIIADGQGQVVQRLPVRDLLPHSFGPEKLSHPS